jgi:hypothetical protein
MVHVEHERSVEHAPHELDEPNCHRDEQVWPSDGPEVVPARQVDREGHQPQPLVAAHEEQLAWAAHVEGVGVGVVGGCDDDVH